MEVAEKHRDADCVNVFTRVLADYSLHGAMREMAYRGKHVITDGAAGWRLQPRRGMMTAHPNPFTQTALWSAGRSMGALAGWPAGARRGCLTGWDRIP